MSDLLNKVKDAMHPQHNGRDNKPAPGESVTTSSHISPTNPGVLQSTTPGIHGARDTGTHTSLAASGDGAKLTGTTWGAHAGKSAAGPNASVVHGDTISPTNPGVSSSTKPGIHGLRDSGTGVGAGFEETERRAGAANAELVAEAAAGFGGAPANVGKDSHPLREQEKPEQQRVFDNSGQDPFGSGGVLGTTTTITGGKAAHDPV